MYIRYDTVKIVNHYNPISSRYIPSLGKIYDDCDFYGDVRCIPYLRSMISDCRKAGYDVILSSAYRSFEKQSALYKDEVSKYTRAGMSRKDSENEAAKSVAFPGTSEHQTGLAFDIIRRDFSDFEKESVITPDKEWLISNCHKYGFILRYPDNAAHITGIIFEPWHFRYVGKEAADEITRLGITLEEYLLMHIADLNGQFSIVFRDRSTDTWSFACDRFGAVPLYFTLGAGGPAFSDSLTKLRADIPYTAAFREDLLEAYLSFSYLPGEDTFFDGIKKALPGYLYNYHDRELAKKRYFTPMYAFNETKTKDQWADNISAVLDDICAEEKRNVTALMSSGIDSNYLCTRLEAENVYTATYNEDGISEASAARERAHHIGAVHHSVLITPDLFFDLTGDAMQSLGQPSGDPSAPVLLGLYREIVKTSHTCYSGEGVDELFMGYYYRDLNAIPENITLEKAGYLGCTQGFNETEKKRILRNYTGTVKMSYVNEAYYLSKDCSRLDQAAMVDMLVWLNGNLLPNVYSLGADCGLGLCTPYLDNRLYDLSLQIPHEFKNDRISNKIVFRKAAEKALGRESSLQPKKGFPVPITSWLKLPEWTVKIMAALTSATAQKFFNTGRLSELYNAFLNDTENRLSWRPVWCLYCFIVWYDRMVGSKIAFPYWQISDPQFNKEVAWPEDEFPDAGLRYFSEAGCFVTSLATMLRFYGIEKSNDTTMFNPWILNEQLKRVGGFDPCADLIPGAISKLYPVEYAGNESYSLERLSALFSDGNFCLITVPGIHDSRHFVMAVRVKDNDVDIIDSGFNKKHLSEFGQAFSIYVFKRNNCTASL